jgi:5-methylcytosine-specific restriction endonuclease McrA
MHKAGYALAALLLCVQAVAQMPPSTELRYCGPPLRAADGTIARRTSVVTAFRKIHPCPATGATTGACPGWAVDHVIPLACGGCDAVSNLQWLPSSIKSAAGTDAKDRWERRIYCRG